MLHLIYSLFYRLAIPFALVYLWWQTRRGGGNSQGWQQRLGLAPLTAEPVIWVHAVSVGETIAAAPLVQALLERRPDVPVLMTAMTATGAARARSLFGDRVLYAYAPFDTPGAVRRFLRRVQPRALVVLETELWPNMIVETTRRGCPVFLANARMSERSARGYQRIGRLTGRLLRRLTWVAAQAGEDAARFRALGAPAGCVSVTGSIKFDVSISDEVRRQAAQLRERFGARPVWIAASTHEGEDGPLLAAHRRVLDVLPDALLVIVPRHPDRFDPVSELVAARGFSQARRSSGQAADSAQVYLGDTMGELLLMYGAADVAFVGGSLIERGGHNPLEPAAWGMPVVTGPHVFNFDTIYQQLEAGGGVVRVIGPDDLGRELAGLLADRGRAASTGQAALAVVEANRGALNRVVEGILSRLAPACESGEGKRP